MTHNANYCAKCLYIDIFVNWLISWWMLPSLKMVFEIKRHQTYFHPLAKNYEMLNVFLRLNQVVTLFQCTYACLSNVSDLWQMTHNIARWHREGLRLEIESRLHYRKSYKVKTCDDDDNWVISKCMDCDYFLCQECQKAHENTDNIKLQKIYTLAHHDLPTGDYISSEYPKCETHTCENLSLDLVQHMW